MPDYHGIIFAYNTSRQLGALVRQRTSSSLPFCCRYRLIDFPLSSLSNAGIHDVGVIMQRDYQSLLDHLGSGKEWDDSGRKGGLRMLPPFGLPEYHTGAYAGTMEALNAVASYIHSIPQSNLVLMRGYVAANIDIAAAVASHEASHLPITAICARNPAEPLNYQFLPEADGSSQRMVRSQSPEINGLWSLEAYIIRKDLLLSMMRTCQEDNRVHFHSDALFDYLRSGGRVNLYVHESYACVITSDENYFRVNMDMLDAQSRASVFPPHLPLRTKIHEEVSTYYGETAKVQNCLIADGCRIEGELEHCLIFSGVHIEPQVRLQNCIVMRGAVIHGGAQLQNVVLDKYSEVSATTVLRGSDKFPFVLPKSSKI